MKREQKNKNIEFMAEDKNKSTRNSRHFFKNDGTKKCVLSNVDVNYFDETKKEWKRVDNTLKEQKESYNGRLGKFKTKISKPENGSKIEVFSNGINVSWKYIGNSSTSDKKEIMNVYSDKFDDTKNVNGSRAVYEDIKDGVNIEYIINGNNVKENIIINKKQKEYAFPFSFNATGLKMKISEDRTKIELYSEKTNKKGQMIEKKEFTIPAPYMFDAENNICNDVHYEIEEQEESNYLFKVVADDEWINDPERILPVVIDPQLITTDSRLFSGTIHTTIYEQTTTPTGGTGETGATTNPKVTTTTEPVDNYYLISRSPSKEVQSEVIIKRELININKENIISAKVVLTCDGTFIGGNILFGGTVMSNVNGTINKDITSLIKNTNSDIDIFLCYKSNVNGEQKKFYATGENGPRLELEYVDSINKFPVKKTFSLVGGAEARVDMLTGDATFSFSHLTDDLMGISLSNIYKRIIEYFNFGTYMRLNICEKLEKNEDESQNCTYIYTDCYGDKHFFNEKFYYVIDDGQKRYVSRDKVQINTDGTFVSTITGAKLYREEVSHDGLTASTKVEGISNIENYESRIDEVKQLEEQVESYKNAIYDFVTVNEDGSIKNEIGKENFSMEDIINSTDRVMPKSEAYSLKSMLVQKDALNDQSDSFEKLNNVNRETAWYLHHSINEANNDLKKYNKVQIANYAIIDKTTGDIVKTISWEEASDINKMNQFMNGNGYLLTYAEATQYRSMLDQINLIDEQISYLKSKSDDYKEQLKKYYKEYVNATDSLKKYKLIIPVNYLMDGTYTKGFNEYGDLVVIYDRRGNYSSIEYETYMLETNEHKKITKIIDKNEKEIQFEYSGKNLSSIRSSNGERVIFKYNNNKLQTVIFPDHSKLILDYDTLGDIITLSYKGNVSKIEFLNGRVKSIKTLTNINSVEDGNTTYSEEYKEISSVKIEYGILLTKVIDDIGDRLIYKFNKEDNSLLEYYEETDGKVTKAEKYHYEAFDCRDIYYAKESSLNKVSYENFKFLQENYQDFTLNDFNRPETEKTGWAEVFKNETCSVKQKYLTKYFYDKNQNLTKKNTKIDTDINGNITTKYYIELFDYNMYGENVKKQSYIVGEEHDKGIDVEEYVYNNGFMIKSFKYNTKDTSSKLYSEKEVSELGEIISEKDESGRYETKFECFDGTTKVRTKISPDGGKLSYGYSPRDGITSITSSTESGEENSTQKSYTDGSITKLTSGEKIFEYTYDYKRRITSVKIDGNEHISFTYSDIVYNGKKAQKIVATYANGATSTTIKDMYGKVLSTTMKDGTETKTATAEYRADGQISKTTEIFNDKMYNTQYSYDAYDNLLGFRKLSDTEDISETYHYDNYGRLDTKDVSPNAPATRYNYYYVDDTDILKSIQTGNIFINLLTDDLNRNRGKEINIGNEKILSEDITYLKVGDHATNIPLKISYGTKTGNGFVIKDNIKYKYNEMGYISEVYENGEFVSDYKYDTLGRLSRENNKKLGKTFIFEYDNNGNILSKTTHNFTLKTDDLIKVDAGEKIDYLYDKDKLISYGNKSFTYDAIGNPLTYKDVSLEWKFGRELVKFGNNTFSYNANGQRVSKNDITFYYDLNGNLFCQSDGIEFIYDNSTKIGFIYNNSTYFYRKDLQGNVISVLDSNGTVMVKYVYDGWGNHKVFDSDGTENTDSTFIGNINPIRYRGYYYDIETGLYYLQSRYYDPETGRFINIDDISYLDPETINGLNLYAYCLNNPVMYVDPNGQFVITLSLLAAMGIAAAVGAGIGIAGTFIGDLVNYTSTGQWKWSSWETYLGNAIGGAIGGAVSLFNPFIGTVIASTIGTFSGLAIGKATGSNTISWGEIMIHTGISFGISLLTAGMTKYAKIPGATKGSHSWQQVFKSGVTKTLRYGSAISGKTLLKGAGYLAISGFTTGFLISNFLQSYVIKRILEEFIDFE